MSNLAYLYDNVYNNISKAIYYYKMAIRKKFSDAMYLLGYQDYKKAKKYYEMALENGYEEAREKLDRIEKGKKCKNITL